jgi:hypothetical protein
MSEPKRILILYFDSMPAAVNDLVAALTRLGAAVTVRECDGDQARVLDAVAAADSVICWR